MPVEVIHTPECLARAERGVGGCWCNLVAATKENREMTTVNVPKGQHPCSGSRWQKVELTKPHLTAIEEFAKDKYRPDGLALICRPCRKVYEDARRNGKAGMDAQAAAKAARAGEPLPKVSKATEATWIDPQVPPPSMKGWVMEQVGGDWLARPDSAEAVGSPEGQAALEAIHEAQQVVKRKANADARRRQRAAAKAQAQA